MRQHCLSLSNLMKSGCNFQQGLPGFTFKLNGIHSVASPRLPPRKKSNRPTRQIVARSCAGVSPGLTNTRKRMRIKAKLLFNCHDGRLDRVI